MLSISKFDFNGLDLFIVSMYIPTLNQILYLSVLKPGSNTRRGSNICWVVQQNQRNKCLGAFKCRVPKLLNLINLKNDAKR